jgi:translation elongation factor EF-G
MGTNLFKKAKENGTTTTAAAKPAKVEVVLNDKSLEATIKRLAKVQEEQDSLATEANDLTGIIKPVMVEQFTKLYNETGAYPGSFNLKAGSASLMVIPTDKYIVIDKDRAELMQKQYGPNIVEEKDTYILDAAMVEKYGDIISKLIEKCKDIPDEDKEKLIKVETKRTIRKGTIQRLFVDFKKFTGNKMGNLLEDIKPVFQMKNVKGS